jgi:tetratricopeptide (TPR) repeat protein
MDFLSTTMHDIPERHRSIRAAFDHSWRLLTDEECWALCQLSVFRGGFDRSAAYQVAGAGLPLLASLRAKSLVRQAENGRYDLHEVIRQYAFAHLTEHPLKDEPHTRHCEYYLNIVRERECLLKSGAQQEAIRQLTGEIDNIRSAWSWAIDHENYDQLEQAGRGFGWYLEITGLYREGIEELDRLVQALKAGRPNDQRRRILGLMLIHQALLYFRKGEFDQARRLYEESILILRPVGEQALLADALVILGTVLHLQGEYARAKSLLEEGLGYARQCSERWFEAWAIFNLGHIDGLIGRYKPGYDQMMEGLVMWRELGDPQAIALGLNFLIPAMISLGRYEEAKAFMYESIALSEQSKNRWGMGTAYRFLGLAYLAQGQPVEAQTHLLKSLEIFGEFAVGWDIARSLTYLGDADMLDGNFAEAGTYYRDALRSAVAAQAIPIALDAILGLGELQAHLGNPENALLFCDYVLRHPSSEEGTRNRAEKLSASPQAELPSGAVTSAHTRANEVTFDELVILALKTAE